MEKTFINKVKQTILDHLEDEKFGVDNLASEIGFSKSQIWRKVKASTGKSVNQFIREIRLEEAAKLIQNNELTASEIAYKVGFNSPSYFNKCFHDYFGITPGEYKDQKGEITALNDIIQKPQESSPKKSFNLIVLLLLAVVLTGITYFFFEEQKHSIAVLPFLDLSQNKDQDYLSDGITEQITLELSKINNLRVISRTSAMSFKDGNKLSSEIAKELDVDYLIEGSVLHSLDSIRVVVQLIEPFPKEKHIWQNSYHQKLENVLNLVRGISNEIATEINIIIVPGKMNKEEYKVLPEAYALYLKGLHLWNQKETQSVKRSIEYLEESIKLDSNYAPAYVTLAEDYILLNKFIPNNEEKLVHRKKCRDAIGKAIELDNSLAEAYIAKGNMIGKFDWNWEEMRRAVEKGLEIDPNNSYGHMLLSKYYLIINDFDKAIDEALLAEKLDPLNPKIGCFVANNYFLRNDYEKSLNQYEKVFDLHPNYVFAWEGVGHVQYFYGLRDEAKSSWEKFLRAMGNDYMAELYSKESFDKSINQWLIGATKGDALYCSNPPVIAQAHMFVDKKQEALEYLEIAYKYRNEDLPVYLLLPHFYTLHSEPRFKDLVQKTNIILPVPQKKFSLKD